MHAPHDPTWLDWLVGIVALVLWNFGPALAHDALDHYFDRTRHRPHQRKDRGSPPAGAPQRHA
ncbi:MAG: hypothetical protein JO329_07400 [Planctomycetaceae bacterium]|nr:hypothetical protein [Planctomycetaceae bacterium]